MRWQKMERQKSNVSKRVEYRTCFHATVLYFYLGLIIDLVSLIIAYDHFLAVFDEIYQISLL